MGEKNPSDSAPMAGQWSYFHGMDRIAHFDPRLVVGEPPPFEPAYRTPQPRARCLKHPPFSLSLPSLHAKRFHSLSLSPSPPPARPSTTIIRRLVLSPPQPASLRLPPPSPPPPLPQRPLRVPIWRQRCVANRQACNRHLNRLHLDDRILVLVYPPHSCNTHQLVYYISTTFGPHPPPKRSSANFIASSVLPPASTAHLDVSSVVHIRSIGKLAELTTEGGGGGGEGRAGGVVEFGVREVPVHGGVEVEGR